MFVKLIGEDWYLGPTELTGETHTKVRKVLNPVFAPQKMFALDGAVRGRARELVGAFKDKGRCDFVKEFAIPFPVSIFLDLFGRSEEHTSELQSLMRISYAVFCLKKKNIDNH